MTGQSLRRALAAFVVACLALAVAGCGSKFGDSGGGGQAPAPAPQASGTVPAEPAPPTADAAAAVRQQLQGSWVVSAYLGQDGKLQEFDITKPAECVTYSFSNDQVRIDWAGQGADNGRYEWQPGSTSEVTAHFEKSLDGQIQSTQEGDVTYSITLSDADASGRPLQLDLAIPATKEQFRLRRRD